MARSGPAFDELLVVMAQAGDREAFGQLHRRWNPQLARAALRLTGNPDTARDLTQECWLAIWKGIGRINHPSRFRSYAFGVLYRRGADHLRGVIRSRGDVRDDAAEPSQLAQLDERTALLQAFAALPADQRLCAHLHFVEGFTLGEIAEVQGIPTGTAKSRLFHARRKLKAALSDKPQSDEGDST
ncbi:MAG: RNA polymerase sigma factor [Pseudomonadota bacterium]|nr:RNA polymerase sigma factor [Pseudomonadota bacterium]